VLDRLDCQLATSPFGFHLTAVGGRLARAPALPLDAKRCWVYALIGTPVNSH
jgi:hypothetical protein